MNIMVTFTVLAKINSAKCYCNTKIARLGKKYFSGENFGFTVRQDIVGLVYCTDVNKYISRHNQWHSQGHLCSGHKAYVNVKLLADLYLPWQR